MSFKKYLLKTITSKSKKGQLDGVPKKVLILRWNQAGGIGDTIILSFMFRELKKHIPGIVVDVITGPSNYQALKSNTYIDSLYLFKGKGVIDIIRTILPLRKKYDAVLDCSFGFTTYSLAFTRLLSPKVMVAVPKSSLKYGLTDKDFKMYDYILEDDQKTHWVEIYSQFLNLLGIKDIDKSYDFPIPESDISKNVRQFVQEQQNHTLLIFNLFSYVPERTIKESDAKEVLDNLLRSLGENADRLRIVMTYPPDKKELIESFVQKYNSPIVLASPPTGSIYEIAYLVRESDVVFSAETSVVHLATVFDKPLVTVYKNDPSSFLKFSPRATKMYIIVSKDFSTLDGFDKNEVVTALLAELKLDSVMN